MKDSVHNIRAGDKVIGDTTTHNPGNVRLGDAAPIFVRLISAGDKVVADTETHNQGEVQLGDAAPVFGR